MKLSAHFNPAGPSAELLQVLKQKGSKIPPQKGRGVGTVVHFSENPNFGINNLLFPFLLPHCSPWSSQSEGGECAEGRNSEMGKNPIPAQNWGGFSKRKRDLSTQGCPRKFQQILSRTF